MWFAKYKFSSVTFNDTKTCSGCICFASGDFPKTKLLSRENL